MSKSNDGQEGYHVVVGVGGFVITGCLVTLIVAFTVEVIHLIAKYW